MQFFRFSLLALCFSLLPCFNSGFLLLARFNYPALLLPKFASLSSTSLLHAFCFSSSLLLASLLDSPLVPFLILRKFSCCSFTSASILHLFTSRSSICARSLAFHKSTIMCVETWYLSLPPYSGPVVQFFCFSLLLRFDLGFPLLARFDFPSLLLPKLASRSSTSLLHTFRFSSSLLVAPPPVLFSLLHQFSSSHFSFHLLFALDQ